MALCPLCLFRARDGESYVPCIQLKPALESKRYERGTKSEAVRPRNKIEPAAVHHVE